MADTNFQPINVLLPSEEVARRLADAVRTGVFRLGSRLPSERTIAEQMAVSRPTVREAVKILVAANILSVKPGAAGGAFVTSESVPLDLIVERPALRPGEIDEALEVRRLILGWIVQTASQYAEDADFDRMKEAIAFGHDSLPPPDVVEVTQEHVNSLIVATIRFDLALAQATRNSLVVKLMELVLNWVEPLRYRTLHTRADLCLSLELVEKMMNAVETGNPIEIDQITERRLSILEQALEKQTGRRLRRSRRPTS